MSTEQKHAEVPELLTTEELVKRLDGAWSAFSLRSMARRGMIPHVRYSNRIRWIWSDVLAWIHAGGASGVTLEEAQRKGGQ